MMPLYLSGQDWQEPTAADMTQDDPKMTLRQFNTQKQGRDI